MFYAHEGSSSDNAFTVIDGFPIRRFVGFETKKERLEEQDRIWKESNHETNLIFCTRKFVEEFLGRNFYVNKYGFIMRESECMF